MNNRTSQLSRAALFVIAATPIIMLAAREVPATLAVIVTLLCTAAILSDGRLQEVIDSLRRLALSPGGIAALSLIFLAGLSVLWSPAPERGAIHVVHFGGGIVLGAVSACAVYFLRPAVPAKALALGICVAAVLLVIDLASDSGLRRPLGLATEDFRLNRAAVALVLLLPLVSVLLLREHQRVLVALTWLCSAAAVIISVSYSAKLGLLVLLAALPLAYAAPLLMHRVIGATAVFLILFMPIVASLANALVPDSVHQAVGYGSLTIRGEIWGETARFIQDKPFFGWGIEAAHVIASLPEAANLSQSQRDLLNWSHTHNAPLQIWLELGAAGALAAAAAVIAAMIQLERLPRPLLPAASTTFAAAFAIACVSHGAWQAWWWGLLALVVTLFAATTGRFENTKSSP